MRLRAPPYDRLVFGGGGVHVLASLACARELQASGALAGVSMLAGASAGALAAVLFALGTDEVAVGRMAEEYLSSNALSANMSLASLFDKVGLVDSESFIGGFLDRVLAHAISFAMMDRGIVPSGARDVTFAQLTLMTGRVVVVAAMDLDSQSTRYFSVYETPDESVRRALCASCAVPLLFTPVVCGSEGHSCCDGGVLDNVPVSCLRAASPGEGGRALVIECDGDGGACDGVCGGSAPRLVWVVVRIISALVSECNRRGRGGASTDVVNVPVAANQNARVLSGGAVAYSMLYSAGIGAARRFLCSHMK